MAADTTILQGEVSNEPENQKLDVQGLLAAFLHSLLQEQRQTARETEEATQ